MNNITINENVLILESLIRLGSLRNISRLILFVTNKNNPF